MACEELLPAVGDYVDGQRDAPPCRALETHLAGCSACRTLLDNIRYTIASYQADRPAMPGGLHEQMLQTLRERWQATLRQRTFLTATPQRRTVLEVLCGVTSHPTAVELHDLARRRLPTITLRTVRRHLEMLAQSGTIQKLEAAGFRPRFDGNPAPHDHLRCLRCGRVEDLAAVAPNLSAWSDYQPATDRRLESVGTCTGCRE
jgi:Fur family transcriptional regulator, ferric uptake regulator